MHIVNINDRREDVDVVNHDALRIIKDVITRINSGEVKAVAIAWVDDKGSIGGNVSEGENQISMWASMENLAKQFHSDILLG